MSRARLLPLLLVVLVGVVAVGAAYALGLLGGDSAPEGGGDALRGAQEAAEGPTGPMRHEDVEGGAATGPSLVGRPGHAPPPPRRPRLRAATVRVVDATGIALAGQVVSVFVGDALHGHFTTGADGRIHLTDLPAGAEVFVALGALDGKPDAVWALTGDALEVRASNVIPMRVDVVDGQTGGLLAGARWHITTPGLHGGEHAISSGASTSVPAKPGMRLRRPFSVETPPDFVDWDTPWETVVSRYATSLEVRHPLRREVSVTVLAIDEEEEDVRDGQVHAFYVAGRGNASPQTGPWMLGGIPVRGVPFFPGQPFRVWVKAPDGRGGEATQPLPAHDHEELTVEIVLKKGFRVPGDVRFKETDNDLPFEESLGRMDRAGGPEPLVGALEVEVIRADGRPAVGARVHVPFGGEHRTDETGVLRLAEVLAGDHEVTLDEPGLVPVSEKVAVVAGGTVRVTLAEPVGATLGVTVKGTDGTPLPYATVIVGQAVGSPWADVAPDGVQRLDPYTDERGRRTLRRVQPGLIRLDGRWGGWTGTLIVTVGDRQTKDVTLLLR